MPIPSIGLTSIKLGDIAGDGGMGLTLAALGATVSESASYTTAEGTKTDFLIEESESPYYSKKISGVKTLTWETYNVDIATLVTLLGGTSTAAAGGLGQYWSMPDNDIELEQSIEVVTNTGHRIEITRAKIDTDFNWDLSKTKLARLKITATVLQPTKVGEKRTRVYAPVA